MYQLRHPDLDFPVSRHRKSEVAIEKAKKYGRPAFVVNEGRWGHLTHVWSEQRPNSGGYVDEKDRPIDPAGNPLSASQVSSPPPPPQIAKR